MEPIVRVPVSDLRVGQPFLEGNGRMWVRVGWESVAPSDMALPPFLVKKMGLLPVCDMGGNVQFVPSGVVVTGLVGKRIGALPMLEYWQYAVN